MTIANLKPELSNSSTQPLDQSVFDQQEVDAIVEVVKSGAWWMGPNGNKTVTSLEKEFASYQNTRYALAVTNGSHALEIILRNLGVAPGTEVIIPAYAPISTGMVVLILGATPVFVDVQKDTMTLDPILLESAITAKTQVILAVHLNGVASNIMELAAIAKRRKIHLVEDCSQAHGASFQGKRVGSFGIAGSFDFHSSQLISGGEGGMIVTSDRHLYSQCWSQHNCGRGLGKAKNRYFNVGTNYRMTVFQAALIQVQLKRFITKVRPVHLQNLAILDGALSQIFGITPQFRHFQLDAPAYHYAFRWDAQVLGNQSRDQAIELLQSYGISVQVPEAIALPSHPLFQEQVQSQVRTEIDSANPSFPVAKVLEDTVICLPHILLSDSVSTVQISEALEKIGKNCMLTS